MFINILLFFIIPWCLGIIIITKDKKTFLITPFLGATIASTINVLGIYFEFWKITPIEANFFAGFPADIGIYAVLPSYMIFLIRSTRYPGLILVIGFSLFTLLLEGILLFFGKVIYYNGWTLVHTFFSYLFPYLLIYWHYKVLKRLGVY